MVLFLAGPAINSIKNPQGVADPRYGAEAMLQAIDVYRSGEIRNAKPEEHLFRLVEVAERRRITELHSALHQRYPNSF